jgi:hypothetical protein
MVYVCGVCGIAIGDVLKKNWSNMVMVMMTLGKKYFFILVVEQSWNTKDR